MKRTLLKSRRKPPTKIRMAAKDQECTIRLPYVCNWRTDTTVLCHSNSHLDGKGMGLKARDDSGAFGCCACHDVVDGRTPRPHGMSYEAMIGYFKVAQVKTRRILIRKGLIKEAE